MSVLTLSKQEVVNVAEALKRRTGLNHGSLKYTILYSEAYIRKMRHEKDEDKAVNDLIDWMLDHLHKANIFAAVSQYGFKEAEQLQGEYPERSAAYNDKKLVDELRSLDYNLADNAGNRFVEPVYYDLFEAILTNLYRTFFDGKNDETDYS
jgi:hypothetical protein